MSNRFDFLIDGYNLLHQTPFMTRDRGPGWMQKARSRLISFIESKCVFDRTKDAPPPLSRSFSVIHPTIGASVLFKGTKDPSRIEIRSLTLVFDFSARSNAEGSEANQSTFVRILFAPSHLEADDLIEELIANHHHPQTLWVVSSDHRIQVAARRRRAKVIESVDWYEEWNRLRTGGPNLSPEGPNDVKDREGRFELTEEEKRKWLDEFGFS